MSSGISPQDVVNALRAVKDPDLGRDIVTLGLVKQLEVGDSRVSFALQLTTPACPVRDQLLAQARAANAPTDERASAAAEPRRALLQERADPLGGVRGGEDAGECRLLGLDSGLQLRPGGECLDLRHRNRRRRG